MSKTIVVDLRDETKAALDEAAREEGLSQNELIDKAAGLSFHSTVQKSARAHDG